MVRIAVVLILLGLILSVFGCTQTQTVTEKLPATPKGWIQGPDGWIPPLPPGFEKPGGLSQEEWDKVFGLASQDTEVVKQKERANIASTRYFWVGYNENPNLFHDSDSNILSGKSHLPTEYTWYYPMILFNYADKVQTERFDASGREVGVDIKTNKIIYVYNVFVLPEKPLR